jgi:hypothetical protein
MNCIEFHKQCIAIDITGSWSKCTVQTTDSYDFSNNVITKEIKKLNIKIHMRIYVQC